MKKIKFLVFGISGDLARRKVLPGIAQFVISNTSSEHYELIGYSRSLVEKSEIEGLFSSSTKKPEISLYQGDYSNNQFFQEVVNNLKPDERLIAYFAVPPMVFLDLLDGFCPYYNAPIDIIIEKPFGQDLDEAKLILKKIDDCKLHNKVHFCDHYLFKNGSILPENIVSELKPFQDKEIKSIKVIALESINVQGRSGYYDSVGALKDMLPAHLFSLLSNTRKYLPNLDLNDIKVQIVRLGQYSNYLQDNGLQSSLADTYFEIGVHSKYTSILLESGKNLPKKETSIEIIFTDASKIYWNIDPEKSISLFNQPTNQENKLTISNSINLDHTNMFIDILEGNNNRFVNYEDTIKGWQLYDKAKEFINENNIVINPY
jgi:glucose-6-phosphate 1-dehydrogenase